MAHFQYLPNPLFSRRPSFLRMLSCNKTTKTGYKKKHSQYKIHYKLFSVFSGKTVANITLKTTAHGVWNLHTLKNKYDLTLSIMFTHCLRKFRPSKKKKYSFFCIRASILRCFDNSNPPYKLTAKSSMAVVKFIHFIIPQLLNKEGALSSLSISQDWMEPIFPLFFSF